MGRSARGLSWTRGEAPVPGGISQSLPLAFCQRDAWSSSKLTLQAITTSALGCIFGSQKNSGQRGRMCLGGGVGGRGKREGERCLIPDVSNSFCKNEYLPKSPKTRVFCCLVGWRSRLKIPDCQHRGPNSNILYVSTTLETLMHIFLLEEGKMTWQD